jgi:hypothetical protein
MKTVTLPLEFVKEAHKASGNYWKQRIEEHVPELKKPTLEVGKWYNSETGSLYLFQGFDIKTYGFGATAGWLENADIYWMGCAEWKTATNQEVETALIQEAKKRGFKKGVKFNNAYTESCHPKNSGEVCELRYQFENNGLFTSNQWVFLNGKWAEIIENPIPKKLQKLIEELGKDKIIEMLK